MSAPMIDEPPLDAARAAQAIRNLAAGLRAAKAAPIFLLERGGARVASLSLKRTFRVAGGACELAPEADQAPLCFAELPLAKVSLPCVSPILAGAEGFAFRPATDVVVQASAYTYAERVSRVTATLRFGAVERQIVARGDRRGERDRAGRLRFSEPEPFTSIPIRWDHAYGGFDKTAWRRGGPGWAEELRPGTRIGYTPYHYPRNPCGLGYLISLDEESFTGRLIPNLEHPYAPLTPERLAVGAPGRWLRGPLPAAWDFQGMTWFPRIALVGLSPRREAGEAVIPAEVERGFAPRDLLSIPPIQHAVDPAEIRLEYGQTAAPGMSFPIIAPDERFELENMHRDRPRCSITLPGEVPEVLFDLGGAGLTTATPHLEAVVLRVDLDEVEMLWSARITVPPSLTEEDLAGARRVQRWSRPREKG